LRRLDAQAMRPDIKPIEPPPAGYDAAFEILHDGAPRLHVRVVRDQRRSALRQTMPSGEPVALELIGIMAPDYQSFGRQIDRWWIDLDADGMLIATAAASVAKTVIFTERSVETYEWRTNRFRVGSDPAFTFRQFRFGGRERTLVSPQDNRPLGFLLPPQDRRT